MGLINRSIAAIFGVEFLSVIVFGIGGVESGSLLSL